MTIHNDSAVGGAGQAAAILPFIRQDDPAASGVLVANAPTALIAQGTIRQDRVELAVRSASLGGVTGSLADVLSNPRLGLTASERAAVIGRLADENPSVFYAGEIGTLRGGAAERAGMDADRSVIAGAVQEAFERGTINAGDLVRIADLNGGGTGPARFAYTLGRNANAMQAGGAAEALADALWSRNSDVNDRAAAALIYASSTSLTQRNLAEPSMRGQAFEALVGFNDRADYMDVPGGYRTMGESHRRDALAAMTQLFTGNPQVLVDRFTGAPARTEPLAQFFSQTMFNPEAVGLTLSGGRNLQATLRTSVDGVGDALLAAAQRAPRDSVARAEAMENYGQFAAAISGGTMLSLEKWQGRMAQNDETRATMASLIGAGVADIAGAGTPVGDLAGWTAGEISKRLLQGWLANPQRPDQALNGQLLDGFETRVNGLRQSTGDSDIMRDFRSAYSAEVLQLNSNLNVNLGGYRAAP